MQPLVMRPSAPQAPAASPVPASTLPVATPEPMQTADAVTQPLPGFGSGTGAPEAASWGREEAGSTETHEQETRPLFGMPLAPAPVEVAQAPAPVAEAEALLPDVPAVQSLGIVGQAAGMALRPSDSPVVAAVEGEATSGAVVGVAHDPFAPPVGFGDAAAGAGAAGSQLGSAVSPAVLTPPVPGVVASPAVEHVADQAGVGTAAVITSDAPPMELAVVSAGYGRRRGVHPLVYVLAAAAFGFGVTGAFFLFRSGNEAGASEQAQAASGNTVGEAVARDKGEEPPKSPPADPASEQGEQLAQAEQEQSGRDSGDSEGSGKAASGVSNGQRPKPANTGQGGASPEVAKAPTASPLPRVGLGGGTVVDGPAVNARTGGSRGGATQLDQADIEKVVSSHRASVRRRCWDPAIAANPHSGKKSTRVTVSLSIAPSGKVSGVSASGGNGFPGLADCIARRVKNWKFPASSGSSQANVPFSFFVQ